jgi:tetratricopeptide (TPR) repeat protein
MERPGNVVADVALDWLAKNADKKFFLWMHLYDPHYPYRPPEPFASEYKDRPYDGEIAFADTQVGRLISFLKQKGLYRNTIVVVTGDHGESLGEHGEKTHGFFIYNATLHVPVIIRIPGEPARTVGNVVNLVDLMPTVLDAIKQKLPAQVQGRSLLPLMENKPVDPRNLYAETFLPRLHFNWSELRSVENQKYHFIDAPKPELYDVSKDPGELENLFDQKRAVTEEMRALLARMIKENSGNQELAEKSGLDPALADRLRSLGYMAFSGGGNPTISNRLLPDPKDRIQVYELISDALSESQHGEFAASTAKLTEALKTDPDSVPIHYLLGLNFYRVRDYPSSVEHLEKVVKASPDYSLAVFQLGLAYARTGNSDGAIASLKKALELDATNFTAAYNLGVVYEQKQMLTEAASSFRAALAVSPDYALAHRSLGDLLFYQGNVDEALIELRRAVELVPQDPTNHLALAKALSAKGLEQEASEEMRKARR